MPLGPVGTREPRRVPGLLLQPSARSVGQLPARGLTQPEHQLGKKRQCACFPGKKTECCDQEPASPGTAIFSLQSALCLLKSSTSWYFFPNGFSSFPVKLCLAFKSHLLSSTPAIQIHPDVPLASKLHTTCSRPPPPPKPLRAVSVLLLAASLSPRARHKTLPSALAFPCPHPGFWGPMQKPSTVPSPLRVSDSSTARGARAAETASTAVCRSGCGVTVRGLCRRPAPMPGTLPHLILATALGGCHPPHRGSHFPWETFSPRGTRTVT